MILKSHFWACRFKWTEIRVLKKRYLHTHVHRSIIHNSQEVETIQMLVNRWVDKQNGVYTNNGTLVGLKKKRKPSIRYNNMDEPRGHYAKWREASHQTGPAQFHSCEAPTIVTFIETARKMWLPGARGGRVGNGAVKLNEFSFKFVRKKFWDLFHNRCEYTKCECEHYWTAHLKILQMVTFTINW